MSKTRQPSLPSGGMSIAQCLGQLAQQLATPHASALPESVLAADRLLEFTKQAWPIIEPATPFVDGWHLGCIAEHLEAMTRLEITRLIINIPPRHCKSILTCVMWPAWIWVKKSDERFIFGTYSDDLSYRDAVRFRDVVRSNWYQNNWGHLVKLKHDQNTKGRIASEKQGWRIATTVHGKGTGEGAGYHVADDPINAEKANQRMERESVWRWWTETMATRFNNIASLRRLVIHQRFNDGDLTGKLLAEKMGYEHLCLPFEAQPSRVYSFPDPAKLTPGHPEPPQKKKSSIVPTRLQVKNAHLLDRRKEGELLWPQRFDAANAQILKNEVRAYGTSGQLQQNPTPDQGQIYRVNYFRYFTEEWEQGKLTIVLGETENGVNPPRYRADDVFWFQCADTAETISTTAAYTCVGTFGRCPGGEMLVWDMWRMRLLIPELLRAIKELRQGSGWFDEKTRTWVMPGAAAAWPFYVSYQAVEKKSSGTGLLQYAQAEGYPIRALQMPGDKVARSAATAGMYESAKVFHRAAARSTWLTDFEGELLAFPGGEYADQADVIAYAGNSFVVDAITRGGVSGLLLGTDSPRDETHPYLKAVNDAIQADQGRPSVMPSVHDLFGDD